MTIATLADARALMSHLPAGHADRLTRRHVALSSRASRYAPNKITVPRPVALGYNRILSGRREHLFDLVHQWVRQVNLLQFGEVFEDHGFPGFPTQDILRAAILKIN